MGTTWVYIKSESGTYTVGFFDPSGNWHSDSDWPSSEKAARRVHYLNGGEEQSQWLNPIKAKR